MSKVICHNGNLVFPGGERSMQDFAVNLADKLVELDNAYDEAVDLGLSRIPEGDTVGRQVVVDLFEAQRIQLVGDAFGAVITARLLGEADPAGPFSDIPVRIQAAYINYRFEEGDKLRD